MEEDVVQYHADKIEHVLRSSHRVSHCRDTGRAGVRLTTQGTTTIQEMPVGEAMIGGTSLDISRDVFPDRCGYHIKLNRGVMVLYLNTMMVTQGDLTRAVLFGTSTTHTKPSFLARIRPVTRGDRNARTRQVSTRTSLHCIFSTKSFHIKNLRIGLFIYMFRIISKYQISSSSSSLESQRITKSVSIVKQVP